MAPKAFGRLGAFAPEAADATRLIEQVAQQQASGGIDTLLGALSPRERLAYLADPDHGARFLGQAVHTLTSRELNRLYPGRFKYFRQGPDFLDTATGERVELTTTGQRAAHVRRYPGVSVVTYDLP